MIDAYAGWRHFADHLAPIWLALPEDLRGRFSAPPEVARWMVRPGAPHPVTVDGSGFPDRKSRAPILVASFTDHHAVRPRPTVLANHGAGQSYLGDPAAKGNECFSGGPGRERVLLHLEPGPLAAAKSDAAGYRYELVGSPRLDPWHDARERGSGERSGESDPLTVAIGFHHNARGCAEQMTAQPHYDPVLPTLAARYELVGHGHPRSWERTAHHWGKLGVRAEPDFARVLDQAAVYVTDTSSTGVEFASTGRPVIFCSAPWYRRDVDHGGRFWEWPRHALHVEEPADLPDAISVALGRPECLARRQWPMVDGVFAAVDGRAAQRSAAAIVSLLAER